MDEELKRLLEENLEVTRENNDLLKKIRRDAMVGFAVKVVVYLVIFGVPLFLISSYLGPLLERTGSATSTTLFGVPSPAEAQKLIEQYQELYGGQ